MRKKANILFILLAALVLLSACGGGGQESSAATETAETTEPTKSTTEEPTAEPEPTEAMPEETTVMDMAGREVTLPAEINTVFGVNNTASILLYTIVPYKMIGWNIKFSDMAKEFMITECVDLPVLGNLYGSGKKAEPEEIISRSPDVIVLAGTKATDAVIASADDLQKQLGIPVLIVLGKMSSYDKAYEFLGQVFGEEERAAELGSYAKNLVAEITETAAAIPEEDKIGVYYARGDDGLETEFKGSPNEEVLAMVGGENVISVEGDTKSGTVSIEEIMTQDPAVILIGNQGASKNAAYEAVTVSGLWKGIAAVDGGRVMGTPQYPFNWFDRPPTVNRLIGLVWLAEELYPEIYEYDLSEEVTEFFKLFYGVDVTEEQISTLFD
jgi:iron complex transport system substrate-binding protein